MSKTISSYLYHIYHIGNSCMIVHVSSFLALSHEFRSGVPWEDLYADDLVIIAESLEECVRRLLTWKEAMDRKG